VIRLCKDPEALSHGAAEFFVRIAREAVAARGRFCVVLSGGGTPRRTYELLAQPPFRDGVDWTMTHVFWGDERCVDPDDPRSNARMAREALLRHVPVPPGQVHPMCRPSPEEGASLYEALLRDFWGAAAPRFDLILLGLGPDGHTASLFPGDPVLSEVKRWVAPVYVAAPDLHRLTLTAPLLNRARVVAFLVTGAAKATVVRDVLQGPRDPLRLPAQLIHPEGGELHWLLDDEAAGALNQESLNGQVNSAAIGLGLRPAGEGG
jgi:6-phosphogluconolactonase